MMKESVDEDAVGALEGDDETNLFPELAEEGMGIVCKPKLFGRSDKYR